MDFIIKFLDSTLIGLLALMIPYFWIKKEKYIAGQLLVSGLWTWLLSHLIKYWFYIPRPYIAQHIEALVNRPPTSGAFPSAHAATAFALAMVVFLHQKKLGIMTLVIAGIISWLRVVGKVHYPIDVFGGALLGLVIGLRIK